MSMDIFRDDALRDKSILVTGGGSGLGKEINKALVAKGALVHICGRRPQVLELAAGEISVGGAAHAVATHVCDIRDAEQVESMMFAIWERGPLTGLVNNAAANFIAPTKDLSPRGFRAITSTVMDGSFYVTLAAGKRWIAEGRKGSVVSNLVTWVWTGSAFVVPSAMAKTALHAMTMSLAVEWGRYGIRLNATAPGRFPTESAWEKLNPIPDAQIERDQFGHRADAPIRRNERVAEPHHISAVRRLRLSDWPDDSDRRRPASCRPRHLRGLGRPDRRAMARRARGDTEVDPTRKGGTVGVMTITRREQAAR